MKPYYFLIIPLFFFLFFSCKKDSPAERPINVDPTNDTLARYNNIFEKTGCKVHDAASISILLTKKDTINNTMFLYGSRTKNDREYFWISSYKANGDLIWDTTVKSPQQLSVNGTNIEINSHAYFLNQIDRERIAIFQIFMKDFTTPIACHLLLMNSQSGRINANIDLNGCYSSMVNLKSTLLIYNDVNELLANPRAKDTIIQISQNGDFISQQKKITSIPSSKDIILSDDTYLSTGNPLKIINIFGETIWGNNTAGSGQKYAITEKNVTISYENSFGLLDTVVYSTNENRITYQSHNTPNDQTQHPNSIICELGKRYTASDGITVLIKSFTISKNGSGTTYYTANYTLENNTADKKIYEGSFNLLYLNKKGGIAQYGFFGQLLPGEFINRTYIFKELDSEKMGYLKYVPFLNSNVTGNTNLYWKVPNSN